MCWKHSSVTWVHVDMVTTSQCLQTCLLHFVNMTLLFHLIPKVLDQELLTVEVGGVWWTEIHQTRRCISNPCRPWSTVYMVVTSGQLSLSVILNYSSLTSDIYKPLLSYIFFYGFAWKSQQINSIKKTLFIPRGAIKSRISRNTPVSPSVSHIQSHLNPLLSLFSRSLWDSAGLLHFI